MDATHSNYATNSHANTRKSNTYNAFRTIPPNHGVFSMGFLFLRKL